MDHATDTPTPHAIAPDTRARTRRLVKRLLVLDALLVIAAAGIWFALSRGDDEANAVNDGLRGSRPPAGQQFPALAAIRGIDPPVPAASELRGDAIQLVATCITCRSGDILGGYLGRLSTQDVPDDARVLVVGWDGDIADWARTWKIDDQLVELHAASSPATVEELRRTFGVGPIDGAEESGITYLYDARGRWRSTFFIGQLDRDDVRHDLETLSRQ